VAIPFPAPFSNLLVADPTIATALQNAFSDPQSTFPNAEALSRICTSLVAIDDEPLSFRHAGRRETETHFSASLLTVAAMLGAFQLRQTSMSAAIGVLPFEYARCMLSGRPCQPAHRNRTARPGSTAPQGIKTPRIHATTIGGTRLGASSASFLLKGSWRTILRSFCIAPQGILVIFRRLYTINPLFRKEAYVVP
jgi:hypothetical protein